MKTRSLLRGLAFPALCALAPLAHADYIPCPAETKWEVSSPLPDPWSSTVQRTTRSEQFTVLINAVEWLVCRYSHAPGEPSVYTSVGAGFRVRLQRPLFLGVSIDKSICPHKTITTEVASPVPAPWKSTKYLWNLEGVTVTELAGQDVIMCSYLATLDSQGVGPSSLLQPLNLGDDKPLAATPKPGPKLPGNLAAEFAVTNASLATVPAPAQRACPTKVGFQGSIAVNGPGEVIYRTVDNKGVAGPQKKLQFAQAGAKPIAFQINAAPAVSPTPSGGGSLSATPKPAGPQLAVAAGAGGGAAASGNFSEANTPGKLWGFMRIEILAPTGGKTQSQDAAWSVQCVSVNQKPGATQIQAQPANTQPGLRAPATATPAKTRTVLPRKDPDKK
jgi:hypothetical protein